MSVLYGEDADCLAKWRKNAGLGPADVDRFLQIPNGTTELYEAIRHGFLLSRLHPVELIAISVIGPGFRSGRIFFPSNTAAGFVAQALAIGRAIAVAPIAAAANEELPFTMPAGDEMTIQVLGLSEIGLA